MKKYLRYITESNSDLSIVFEECQPFIKEMTTSFDKPTFLYHGTSDAFAFDEDYEPVDVYKKKFEYREGPKHTTNYNHNKLNKLFIKHFGKPYRNGVFTAIDDNSYGDFSFIFIPVGNYTYVYHKDVEDLFRIPDKEKFEMVPEYKTDGLYLAEKNNSEISFICDEYFYLIKPSKENIEKISKLWE